MPPSGHLLIVEDDESLRRLLGRFLVRRGYGVALAADGHEALRRFTPGRFDAVVSDLLMPGIDGLALLRRIRQLDRRAMFLMITGYPSAETALDAVEHGACAYLAKPLDFEHLRLELERALEFQRLRECRMSVRTIAWALLAAVPAWLGIWLLWSRIV